MKNFLRALKYSLKYQRSLILSIICAFMAAAFWGLSFTSVYPVMKILSNNLTLQNWVEQRIDALQSEVEFYNNELTTQRAELRVKEQIPEFKVREREVHRLMGEIARFEAKQDRSATSLWRYQQLKRYFIRFLPSDRFLTLTWLLVLVLIGVALKGVFEFFQDYLVGSVLNRTLYDLRNRFFRNAIHQDLRQIQENGSAEIMARFTNDMESVGNGMKILYGRVIAEPLRILACGVIACWISWQLTLLFLILVPSALLTMTKASRVMKKATRRVLERMSSIYKILQETFLGVRVVKVFTMEPYERRRFNAATKDYCNRSMRVTTIDAFAGPIIEVLGTVAVCSALLAGAYLVLNHQTHLFGLQMCSHPLEPESLIQLYALLGGMADPVRKLSSVYTKMQSSAAAADRVFAFMDRVPRVQPNASGPRIKHSFRMKISDQTLQSLASTGVSERILSKMRFLKDKDFDSSESLLLAVSSAFDEQELRFFRERLLNFAEQSTNEIEFHNVCFSYQPGKPTLENISFKVRGGETIAIVGPNGCGKTTLLNLIPRFYDPDHGSILIDGIDLREAHLRSLRKQIGVVTQDTILFDDTIYNNIAYGSPGATRDAIESAANKAFAHEFIMEAPLGYETQIGEMRVVSGGEKQRIALARAILRDPSILILDEFTSSIDAVSDSLIHAALKDFVKGRTTFIITHKMHTLEIADRIIVLNRGNIEAIGTHSELLKISPLFRTLQEANGQRMVA